MAALQFNDDDNPLVSLDLSEQISPLQLDELQFWDFQNPEIEVFQPSTQPNIQEKMSFANLTEGPKFNLDRELVKATIGVLQTGKFTPLIKEELKCTIQSRRLARGDSELVVDLTKPMTRPLSPQEEADAHKCKTIRRERNRIAALKSRRKKKMEMATMQKTCKELEEKNEKLKTLIKQLEAEKAVILKSPGCFNLPLTTPFPENELDGSTEVFSPLWNP